MLACPASGLMAVARVRSSVDLPEPLRPVTASTLPAATRNETSISAHRRPYRRARFCASTASSVTGSMMPQMRRLAPLLVVIACATPPRPPAAPAPTTVPATPAVYGFTVEEEAHVLRMEDRREYDAAFAEAWLRNPNALHRARMALALGRIGPHAFERAAVVGQLVALAGDAEPIVRTNVAFALGQIGEGADTLVQLANDANGEVAAEAVEALSKLKVPLARYAALADASRPEGVRVRAIRFLFRLRSDDANAIAINALGAPSTAVRQAAAYTLNRFPSAAARRTLELLANDPDTLTRAYVMTALGRIGAPESLPVLIAALSDKQPWVRTNALAAIARLAAKDAKSIERPALAQDA